MFSLEQALFLSILLIAVVLLITERIRNDLVALFIIVSLSTTGILSPEEALSGFSSEPAIVLAGIFVLAGALHATGFSDSVGALIGRLAGESYTRSIITIMPSVALLSAFTHHVTTTALMVPIALSFSKSHNIAPSKLLMPISFAASLGTTITLIGAPAFLIADEILRQHGSPGLGVFSISPIGLTLSLLGTLFVLFIGQFLLPSREGMDTAEGKFRLTEYFTEIVLLSNSLFLNKTVSEIEENSAYGFQVIAWMREGRRYTLRNRALQEHDILLVRATPEDLVAIRKESGVELHPIHKYGEAPQGETSDEKEIGEQFVQAIVAPRSDLLRRSIAEIDFYRRFGVVIVGLWRQKGWVREELSKVRIRQGDVLVLQGDEGAFSRVAQDPAFLMLVPFHGETKLTRKAPIALGCMVLTVLAGAFNVMPLQIASLAGAGLTILTGCITPRAAYRAIDTRIFVFIAGAIPLGLAMEKTGISTLLATTIQQGVEGISPFWILLLLYAVVAVLTQFMSDAATTALFGPVAAALALGLHHRPEPYVVTVAMASVTAFLTPIGHHGNLLIYTPGGYTFLDFVKVGTPLTLLVAGATAGIALFLWPLIV